MERFAKFALREEHAKPTVLKIENVFVKEKNGEDQNVNQPKQSKITSIYKKKINEFFRIICDLIQKGHPKHEFCLRISGHPIEIMNI